MGKVLMMRKGKTHTAPSAGILASEIAVGSSVYLMENGSPVEYLVVNQGIPSGSSLYDSSCDGMWLLRKQVNQFKAFSSTSGINYYFGSQIHTYLNDEFLAMFNADTQSLIKQVKIPYCQGQATKTVYSGSSGLDTKAFLLSVCELGAEPSNEAGSSNWYMPKDGEDLEYFTPYNFNKGIAYREDTGDACGWWLRTSYGGDKNSVYYVTAVGAGGNLTQCTQSFGIRPALILPHNALFDKNTLVLKGVA